MAPIYIVQNIDRIIYIFVGTVQYNAWKDNTFYIKYHKSKYKQGKFKYSMTNL